MTQSTHRYLDFYERAELRESALDDIENVSEGALKTFLAIVRTQRDANSAQAIEVAENLPDLGGDASYLMGVIAGRSTGFTQLEALMVAELERREPHEQEQDELNEGDDDDEL